MANKIKIILLLCLVGSYYAFGQPIKPKYVAKTPGCRCISNSMTCNSIGFSVGFSLGRRSSSCLPGLFMCCDAADLSRSSTKDDYLLTNIFNKFFNLTVNGDQLAGLIFDPDKRLDILNANRYAEQFNKLLNYYGSPINADILQKFKNGTEKLLPNDTITSFPNDQVTNGISTHRPINEIETTSVHNHENMMLKVLSANNNNYSNEHGPTDNTTDDLNSLRKVHKTTNLKGDYIKVSNSFPKVFTTETDYSSEQSDTVNVVKHIVFDSLSESNQSNAEEEYLEVLPFFTIKKRVPLKQDQQTYIAPLTYSRFFTYLDFIPNANTINHLNISLKYNPLEVAVEDKLVTTERNYLETTSNNVDDKIPKQITLKNINIMDKEGESSKTAEHLMHTNKLESSNFAASETSSNIMAFNSSAEISKKVLQNNVSNINSSEYGLTAANKLNGWNTIREPDMLTHDNTENSVEYLGRADRGDTLIIDDIANALLEDRIHLLNRTYANNITSNDLSQIYADSIASNEMEDNDVPLSSVSVPSGLNSSSSNFSSQQISNSKIENRDANKNNSTLPKACINCEAHVNASKNSANLQDAENGTKPNMNISYINNVKNITDALDINVNLSYNANNDTGEEVHSQNDTLSKTEDDAETNSLIPTVNTEVIKSMTNSELPVSSEENYKIIEMQENTFSNDNLSNKNSKNDMDLNLKVPTENTSNSSFLVDIKKEPENVSKISSNEASTMPTTNQEFSAISTKKPKENIENITTEFSTTYFEYQEEATESTISEPSTTGEFNEVTNEDISVKEVGSNKNKNYESTPENYAYDELISTNYEDGKFTSENNNGQEYTTENYNSRQYAAENDKSQEYTTESIMLHEFSGEQSVIKQFHENNTDNDIVSITDDRKTIADSMDNEDSAKVEQHSNYVENEETVSENINNTQQYIDSKDAVLNYIEQGAKHGKVKHIVVNDHEFSTEQPKIPTSQMKNESLLPLRKINREEKLEYQLANMTENSLAYSSTDKTSPVNSSGKSMVLADERQPFPPIEYTNGQHLHFSTAANNQLVTNNSNREGKFVSDYYNGNDFHTSTMNNTKNSESNLTLHTINNPLIEVLAFNRDNLSTSSVNSTNHYISNSVKKDLSNEIHKTFVNVTKPEDLFIPNNNPHKEQDGKEPHPSEVRSLNEIIKSVELDLQSNDVNRERQPNYGKHNHKTKPNYLNPIHINSVQHTQEVPEVPKKKFVKVRSIFSWLFG